MGPAIGHANDLNQRQGGDGRHGRLVESALSPCAETHPMTATAPKTLHIARKLLSVLGKIQITDDAGLVLYEGAARWAWLTCPWRITQHGQEVAPIARKPWSFTPIWSVSTHEEHFILRGKFWSWRRHIANKRGSDRLRGRRGVPPATASTSCPCGATPGTCGHNRVACTHLGKFKASIPPHFDPDVGTRRADDLDSTPG